MENPSTIDLEIARFLYDVLPAGKDFEYAPADASCRRMQIRRSLLELLFTQVEYQGYIMVSREYSCSP